MIHGRRGYQSLRGQLAELGSAVRQLNQSGLDSATARLLLSRKRAELEDLLEKSRDQPAQGWDHKAGNPTRVSRRGNLAIGQYPGDPRSAFCGAVVVRGTRFTVSTNSAHIITTCSLIQSDSGEGSMKQSVNSSREAPTCKCEACGDRMIHLGSLRET